MNAEKRPVPVLIIACVYIAVGVIGFVYHFRELLTFGYDGLLIEATEFVAIVCGIFMLRGHNWARWLALAWMVFHVVLSAFHAWPEFAVHCLFCAAIAWFLYRPAAGRYFRGDRIVKT